MIRTPMMLAAACALAMGGAAFAQNAPATSPNGAMGANNGGADASVSNNATPAAPAPMSKSDTSTMKMCQAMSPSAMAKSGKCKAFMGRHPEMFNADGTMKPGMSPG